MLFGILIQRFVIVIWVRDDLIKKSAKLEPAWREKILLLRNVRTVPYTGSYQLAYIFHLHGAYLVLTVATLTSQ